MKRGDLSDSVSVTGLPISHDWRVRMKRGDLSDSVSVTGLPISHDWRVRMKPAHSTSVVGRATHTNLTTGHVSGDS